MSAPAERASRAPLWAGCTVLAADAAQLATLRSKAVARGDVLVADMPEAAQLTRVYAEYLDLVSRTPAAGLPLLAVGLVGPRNAVDRLVIRLPLL